MRCRLVLGVALLLLSAAGGALADEPADDAAKEPAEAGSPLDWEGPLPADRDQDLAEKTGRGLWLGTELEGAWLSRDPHLGAALVLGFEHRWGALHLRAPVRFRAWDLPPQERSYGPFPCGPVRCVPFERGPRSVGLGPFLSPPLNELEPLELLTFVDELRVFKPGAPVSLRVGPERLSLGRGLLVRGLFSEPLADRQGALGRVGTSLFDGGLTARAVIADLTQPWTLMAGRAAVRPERLFPGETGPWRSLVSDLELAVEAAADLAAPSDPGAVDPRGDVLLPTTPGGPAQLRPLAQGGASLTWPLGGDLLKAVPFLGVTGGYGLSPTGGEEGALGAGATAGLTLTGKVPWVGVALDVAAGVDSPGHRTGLFSDLYLLERRRVVTGASVTGGGLLRVPAPGGLHARAGLELAVADVLAAGARGWLDSAPGGNAVEAHVDLALFGALASARLLKRGVGETALAGLVDHRAPGAALLDDARVWDATWLGAAELFVPVWGPLAAYARWTHAVRFIPGPGKVRADDDVMIGVSTAVRLDSPWLDSW